MKAPSMVRVLAGTAAALFVLALATPALAQDGGQSIKGKMEYIEGEVRRPVEGVEIVVLRDGTPVAGGISDAAGDWEIPVPPGTYRVEIVLESLPEGVGLTDPERQALPDVVVREGQAKTVRFALGPGLTSGVGNWDRAAGLFIIGLKFGAIVALASIGLSLVFSVTGLVNFAHGDAVTLGAVLAFYFNASNAWPGLHWHILLAAIPAIVLTAAFGGAQELFLWRPLRRRQSSLISMLVISIGLAFTMRYLILVFFKGLPRPYTNYVIQDDISVLGVSLVPKNLVIIAFSVAVLAAVGLFLQRTKLGTAMRAVADNPDLSESSGIDVNRVVLVTWVVGSGLAGLGGVMFGISEQVQWDMGFKLLLLIFAAVVLGGLGTAFGAMVGGFVIGVAVEMSTLVVPTEFKTVIALGVLVVMLLVRPQGLLGDRERIG